MTRTQQLEELKRRIWQIANDVRDKEIFTQLRDTLLPKLISGELLIEDAEKMLKAEVGK